MRRVLMVSNALPNHSRIELEDRVMLDTRPGGCLPDREGKLLLILVVKV